MEVLRIRSSRHNWQRPLFIIYGLILISKYTFSTPVPDTSIEAASKLADQSPLPDETDNENSRKVLGSSVVTSVSVIMETSNGSHKYFADAAGRPVLKPITSSSLASPVTLINPDRYEFYTFNDDGELVKRQMTLPEIQKIIAAEGNPSTNYSNQSLLLSQFPLNENQIKTAESRVHDVVANVQNVLKEEIAAHSNGSQDRPFLPDMADLSPTWTMFGNTDDIQDIALFPEIDMAMDQPSPEDLEINLPSQPPLVAILSSNKPLANEDKLTSASKAPVEGFWITAVTQELTSTVKATPDVTTTESPTIITNTNPSSEEYPVTDKIKTLDETTKKHSEKLSEEYTINTIPDTIIQKNENKDENIITDTGAPPKLFTWIPDLSTVTVSIEEEDKITSTTESIATTTETIQNVNLTIDIADHELEIQNTKFVQIASSNDLLRPTTESHKHQTTPADLTNPTAPPIATTLSSELPRETSAAFNHISFESVTEEVNLKTTEEITTPQQTERIGTTVATGTPLTKTATVTMEISPNTEVPLASAVLTTGTSSKKDENIATEIPTTTETSVSTTTVEFIDTKKAAEIPKATETPASTTTIEFLDTKTEQKVEEIKSTESTNLDSTTEIATEKTTLFNEATTFDESTTTIDPIRDDNIFKALTDVKSSVINSIDHILAEIGDDRTESTALSTTTEDTYNAESIQDLIKANTTMDVYQQQAATIASNLTNKQTTEYFEIPRDTTIRSVADVEADVKEYSVAITDHPLVEPTTKVEMSIIRETSSISIQTNPTDDLFLSIDFTTKVPTNEESLTETKLKINGVELKEEATTDSTTKLEVTTLETSTVDSKSDKRFDTTTEHLSTKSDLDASSTELSAQDDKTPAEDLLPPKTSTEDIENNSLDQDDFSLESEENLEPTSTELPKLEIKSSIVRSEDDNLKGFPIIKEIFTTEIPEKFTTIQYVETTIKMDEEKINTNPLLKADFSLEKEMEPLSQTTTENIDTTEGITKEVFIDKTQTEKVLTELPDISTTQQSQLVPDTTQSPSASTTTIETDTTTTEIHSEITADMADEVTTTTEQNKNSWKLVPIIKPHLEKVNPSPDKLKLGLFGFQRPSLSSLGFNRPAAVAPSAPTPYTAAVNLKPASPDNLGLESTIQGVTEDLQEFSNLCNELAFNIWNSVTAKGVSNARSVVISPFAITSMLSMIFLGARGPTSGEMNEILKLDDMVTFNPHLVLRNVTDSIEKSKTSGVAKSVMIRELFSDKGKGKLLEFYKERVRQFYNGHVEEANFKIIGNLIKHRTNLLVKKETDDAIPDFIRGNLITLRPPLAAISANVFQTDCTAGSTEGRDGEIHFVVSPSAHQRRLIPIPATVYRSGFLAGYDPELDATVVALGHDQTVSTIYVIPGQQGNTAPGDGLIRLEKQLIESSFKLKGWTKMLRTLTERHGLEVQIPRFSHRSVLNATGGLQKMGLKEIFNPTKADLRGLNGNHDGLHLSDMVQINNFTTCGEKIVTDSNHHIEVYPAVPNRLSRSEDELRDDGVRDSKYLEFAEEPRDYQRAFHDPVHDPTIMELPLALRPRQARIPETPRIRFDKPFLYYVRHNPTGLILYMGRFNPRP